MLHWGCSGRYQICLFHPACCLFTSYRAHSSHRGTMVTEQNFSLTYSHFQTKEDTAEGYEGLRGGGAEGGERVPAKVEGLGGSVSKKQSEDAEDWKCKKVSALQG